MSRALFLAECRCLVNLLRAMLDLSVGPVTFVTLRHIPNCFDLSAVPLLTLSV